MALDHWQRVDRLVLGATYAGGLPGEFLVHRNTRLRVPGISFGSAMRSGGDRADSDGLLGD